MVKRGRRKPMAPESAAKYFVVARALRKSARDLEELADEGDSYGNALAIVSIHSAVAYVDALSITFGGIKSSGGDHLRAVDALKTALGNRMDPDALKELTAILREKDKVAYQGVFYSVASAKRLLRRLSAFADWAELVYDRRPARNPHQAKKT